MPESRRPAHPPFGQVGADYLITLLSSPFYVATREVVYFKFMPDFADKYVAHMIDRAKSAGATQEKIEKATREAEQFKEMYNNPSMRMNAALTCGEVFPTGLGLTLLSASILRKKSSTP